MVVDNTESRNRVPLAKPATGNEANDHVLVSIIMPAYQMAAFLPEALHSIEAQTYTHWEAIIVDDAGPEDGTVDIVTQFTERNPDHHIVFERHEVNQGVSAARNTAIRLAEGEVLAFLDPDDYWEAEHLETLLKRLIPEQYVVATSEAHVIRTGISPHGRKVRKATEREIETFPHSLAERNFITISATVAKSDAIREVGGFDEGTDIQHAEDYDLWVRLIQADACFCFVKRTTSNYRKHPAAATIDTVKGRQRREVVYRKHAAFFVRSLLKLLEMERERNERAELLECVLNAISRVVPLRLKKVLHRYLGRSISFGRTSE